jgi:ABC-type transport system involved in multi-copper enzyme maturation permease subunit
MSVLNNIRSVAKYESKLLMRSWFYRIFLILAVVFLCFLNFSALISEESGGFWLMKALSSNIPYVNLLFLNTGQAVIAVFLSSEFLKSDKKLDTSEVFYVHPLSNAEYVIGKIWGNLGVFFRLDLIIIVMVLVFNLASGIPIDWTAYATYFLLICVPTLIYIFGLSVSLMLILKNQAITFIILLGYIALTLFYIGDKFYYLLDYMAYNLPLMKSSIVGFTNWEILVNHRCIYLLLGLGFVCLSIFLFRRLPNTRYGRYRWLVLSACFLIAGCFAAYNHVATIQEEAKMRGVYTEINNKYVHTPKIVVDSYDIRVEQHPATITSEVVMKGVAMESSAVFTFCLNPSLQVREIKENGKDLSFDRDHQIVRVDFGRELAKGDTALLVMKYDGKIDGGFCYLDIPAELLQQEYSNVMFRIDKQYRFQSDRYLLFTPETYWYPRPGVSYSSESPDWQQAYFSNFRLTVKTINGLKALSQGTKPEMDAPTDSLFIFETDFPSPSITLIIGDYEQKSIDVDSTEFSIWHLKGHDYFSSAFDSIMDTIPAQIRERRRSIESTYSLDYSFKRFSLVEVPVQFYSYARTWTQAQEKMQPEMVLFPEKGCLFDEADVVRRAKNEKKWAKRNGQDINDEEAAIRTLNAFMWILQRTESDFNWSSDRGSMNVTVKVNPYLLFPQLYNFRYNLFSSEWPVANRMIELYLQDRSDNNDWIRQMNGISNNEKANLLMEERPFKTLLSDVEQRDLLDNVISQKANSLFAPAECTIGYKEYRDSLRAVLQRNIFTNLRFENLLDTMGAIAGKELVSSLRSWNDPTPLPVYIVGTPEVIHISNRDKEAYVVKLQITNDSDQEGIIHVEINSGGQNAAYDPRAKRKVSFAAHETKRLVSVWDEAPRNISVNTLVSANLPNLINLPVNNILRERNKTVEEEGDFIVRQVSYNIPGEVIVDNEDSLLFVLSEPDVVGLLPQWLNQVDNHSFRYSGVSNWRPPLQWTLTTNDKYYGEHIRSAYVIKSGSGSQTATWKIPVPATGPYDLYYYVYKPEDIRRGGRNRRGEGEDAEYHFKIQYDDEENAYINIRRSDEGWNLLGTYYFNEDTVKVILTNDCKLRSVTADAVKIVRK